MIEVDEDYANKIMDELGEHALPSSFLKCSTLDTLDNFAKVHVVRDKSLFSFEILEPSMSDGLRTVTVRKNPQGIGATTAHWNFLDGHEHKSELRGVLCYLDSPVNVISVTELAQDNKDSHLNG